LIGTITYTIDQDLSLKKIKKRFKKYNKKIKIKNYTKIKIIKNIWKA